MIMSPLVLVHFIQKTFLENLRDKAFRSLLVVETFPVFAFSMDTDHQYFMILAIVMFTLLNLIYQGRRSAGKN